MKKALAAVICASMITLTGCYGSYACFNKLLSWNGTLGNKWLNSIVHFAMMVIPVYGIATFVDILVLNTVEFWTGSNPLAAGDSYYEQDAQGNTIAAVKNADGSLSATITTAQGETAQIKLERDGNVVRALDAEGNVVAVRELEK
ncbi:DUF3332 family protein [Fibrobacter sp. UWP2]|uniref:DUF3332 family protein n=1 Tax=Fibrobacter sp. UWP2 TaxID=1896216 RepID=UPI000923595B|nr:DUF3332 family protein [Fibrobacter sp. UWP2]SHI32277.1 protein of unknown function [Fibrobacter sp. UWP2]